MRRLLVQRYQPEVSATFAEAERVRVHHFEFFGEQFDCGPTIDWHADPGTGRRWPVRFHADVPVHSGDLGCGDVKYVWELNRHQFLIDLGKAHFLGGGGENLGALRSIVLSWLAENRYATGVNWACALEPAFRSLSWLWAYFLTIDDLDDEFHVEWLHGFYDHGRFLARHLEHYSSPFNHLIGEAAALYMLGASFPEFGESDRWRSTARSVLESRLDEQFYADGGSVEQSTFYHHATVGFYLLAALTARGIHEELSDRVWRAIERGLDFSMALLQPDGRTPEIGGADDGKPIRMRHSPLWDFRAYHSIGAVLFERPDFKYIAERFHEDALWLLGPTGLRTFDSMVASAPTATLAVLPASGYIVMRSNWSEQADYICFDCGEQAAGIRVDAVPNSMHGHADCLSVVASLGGRRLLVDSGFYAYNCGGPWEAHFRETAAHNTARVDGRDQARHLGKMAWAHGYRATLEGWIQDSSNTWAVASHDGYARGPEGVRHRRAVSLQQDYLVLYDEFVGIGEHDLEVNFQFAPGVVEPDPRGGVLFDGIAETVWTSNVAWHSELRRGGPSPQDGWIAPSLGVRREAPRLTLRARTANPRTSLLTVLALRSDRHPRVCIVPVEGAEEDQPALLAVSAEGLIDWVTLSNSTAEAPIATDAYVAVCRLVRGTAVERLRVGGTYLYANADRLAVMTPFPHVATEGRR